MPIHGFGPVGEKKDPKKGQEEFSQGGGKGGASGTSVIRPTGEGDSKDPMQDIIRAARVNAKSSSDQAMGRSLGTITIYKNGFKLGDDAFQHSSDPKNASFIKSLKEGVVPPELEQRVIEQFGPQVESVGISCDDKSSEEYVVEEEKVKFSFATSQGVSLGGRQSPAPAALLPRELQVDHDQPTTTIQVVLADRSRLRVLANQSATVRDLYQHVLHAAKLPLCILQEGFPPRALTNYGLTLKEAGLIGASVTQR